MLLLRVLDQQIQNDGHGLHLGLLNSVFGDLVQGREELAVQLLQLVLEQPEDDILVPGSGRKNEYYESRLCLQGSTLNKQESIGLQENVSKFSSKKILSPNLVQVGESSLIWLTHLNQ